MRYGSELLIALALHLLLVLFFTFSFTIKPKLEVPEPKEAIQAFVFDEEAHAKKLAQQAEKAKQEQIRLTKIKIEKQQETNRLAAIEKAKEIEAEQVQKAEIERKAQQREVNRLFALEETQRIEAEKQEIEELAEIKKQEIEQAVLKAKFDVIEKELAVQKQRVIKEKEEANQVIAEAKHKQALAKKRVREKVEKTRQQKVLKKAEIAKNKKQQQQAAIKKEAIRKKAASLAKIKQKKAKEETARLTKIKKSKEAEKEKLRLKNAIAADMASRSSSAKSKLQIAEKKRQEQARKKQQADQKASAVAKASQIQEQQLGEAAKIKTKQDISQFTAALRRRVKARWNRPISMSQGLSCVIRVNLMPSGKVIAVNKVKSSGDELFDRSALNAVRNASPLPIPDNPVLFEEHLKSFTFTFRPE